MHLRYFQLCTFPGPNIAHTIADSSGVWLGWSWHLGRQNNPNMAIGGWAGMADLWTDLLSLLQGVGTEHTTSILYICRHLRSKAQLSTPFGRV
jgi:hypothetical protein